MIPDIELQLQVITKSLKDNVLPAIDSHNQLAQQQMQLALASLEIAMNHLPLVHGTLRRDLSIQCELAENILAMGGNAQGITPLQEELAHARHALQDPAAGFTQLQIIVRALRDCIGQVIAANPTHTDLEKLVIGSCAATLSLGRAWNKPMGFEPDPAAVAGLHTQLN